MSDLNQIRSTTANHLNDAHSPGKIDKYEALELKQKALENREAPEESVKAFIGDQIKAGKVEQGEAMTVLEGLVGTPTPDLSLKVAQLTDSALAAIRKATDFGFWGDFTYDGSASGSENADDVAKLAEQYLGKLKALAPADSSLRSVVDAALDGGSSIKDPEKRLNSYITTLKTIQNRFGNSQSQEMQTLGSMTNNALDALRSAIKAEGGWVNADGTVRMDSHALYNEAYSSVRSIREAAVNNPEIRQLAQSGLAAAQQSANRSYNAGLNVLYQTLLSIQKAAGQAPAAPVTVSQPTGAKETTVETTVTTKIKTGQ